MAWQQILRPGDFVKDGESCALNRRRFIEAVRNFGRRSNDVMLDHDHQSCLVAENGRPAVALGWFTALAVVEDRQALLIAKHGGGVEDIDPRHLDDGLYGWLGEITPAGKELLRGGQYRYLSGAFDPDAVDERGKAIGMDLFSVAATNNPFLSSMQPLDVGFSRSGATHVLTMSQGLRLRAAKEKQMGTKYLIRSSNAEFTKLVAVKVNEGLTVQEAVLAVNAEHPKLYSSTTPSGAGGRRFDNAGDRIAKGTPTAMPAAPLDARAPAAVQRATQWSPRAENSDPVREKRDALYMILGRLFPSIGVDGRCRIADIGSGLAFERFKSFKAKTPDLEVQAPSLSRQDQGRLNAALRNLDEDLVDTYADRGPLE